MPDHTGLLYYVSFLFEDGSAREKAYGRELARGRHAFLPRVLRCAAEKLSGSISASITPQEPRQMQGWEILYRRKGFHHSGQGVNYSIEMVVGVPDEIGLETLLREGKSAVGECRKVSHARILLTTDDSYARSELEYLSRELQAVFRETETPQQSIDLKIVDTEKTDLWATICSIGDKPRVVKSSRAYLAGNIIGSVRDVLHIYEVMNGMELRLKNESLIFV